MKQRSFGDVFQDNKYTLWLRSPTFVMEPSHMVSEQTYNADGYIGCYHSISPSQFDPFAQV